MNTGPECETDQRETAGMREVAISTARKRKIKTKQRGTLQMSLSILHTYGRPWNICEAISRREAPGIGMSVRFSS